MFYGGSDNYISRYEFAMEIAEIFKFDKSLIKPIDTKQLTQTLDSYAAVRPKHSGLKIDKIEKELNILSYSNSYSLKKIKNIIS